MFVRGRERERDSCIYLTRSQLTLDPDHVTVVTEGPGQKDGRVERIGRLNR